MAVGIIDIGTNSVLLLIAEIGPNPSIKILHDECRLVRLGEGLNSDHEFQPPAMERTMIALHDFATICKKHHCDSIYALGTAGFRMAKNARAFVDRVSTELGIKIKVIDGQEEARLIYRSCEHDFGNTGKISVLDIGGGSTEIVTQNGQNIDATSFPFGVVTLTEQFLHSDPPSSKEIASLVSYVQSCLSPKLKHFNTSTLQHDPLITTAGTPTTLAAIHLELKEYDSKLVHSHQLTVNDLKQLSHQLCSLTLSERAKIPCLPEKRADVIIAGVQILMTVMERMEASEITVSDHGLRYGILYGFI